MRVQERVLDQCQPCAAGSFRNDTLDRACYACGLDEYQDTTGQTQCKSCPPHSYTEATGSNSVLLCLCESGYEWDETSQTCVECTAGTSKGRGAGTCQQCPEDSFALARSGQCTACGPNERAPAGSGSPFACNCRPGFGSADGGSSCSLCGNGTFSGGGTGAAANSPHVQRPACEQCPANKNSTQGSTERGNCKCVPIKEDGEPCGENTHRGPDYSHAECKSGKVHGIQVSFLPRLMRHLV